MVPSGHGTEKWFQGVLCLFFAPPCHCPLWDPATSLEHCQGMMARRRALVTTQRNHKPLPLPTVWELFFFSLGRISLFMVSFGSFTLSSNSPDCSHRKCPQWHGILNTKARKSSCLHPFVLCHIPEGQGSKPHGCLTGEQEERQVKKLSRYNEHCVPLQPRSCLHQNLLQNCLTPRLSFSPLPQDIRTKYRTPAAAGYQKSGQETEVRRPPPRYSVCVGGVGAGVGSCSFVPINSWLTYQWLKFWSFHIKSGSVVFVFKAKMGSQHTEPVFPNGNTRAEQWRPSQLEPLSAGAPACPLVAHRAQPL